MANSFAEMAQGLISRWGRPARMIAVAVVAFLLLIPLQMVESVVRERYQTYRDVVADIAGAWSSDQLIAGPILMVPYTERVEVREEFISPQGEKKTTQRWESCRQFHGSGGDGGVAELEGSAGVDRLV
jgi:inner membrane protein involved in colicin E2 resistance